jgi:hypothetical protein
MAINGSWWNLGRLLFAYRNCGVTNAKTQARKLRNVGAYIRDARYIVCNTLPDGQLIKANIQSISRVSFPPLLCCLRLPAALKVKPATAMLMAKDWQL